MKKNPFYQMYCILADGIGRAVIALEDGDFDGAKERLIDAQLDADDIFIKLMERT